MIGTGSRRPSHSVKPANSTLFWPSTVRASTLATVAAPFCVSSETVSEITPDNARHVIHRLEELQPLEQRGLAEAQARYKAAFDRSVLE
jgi:hypothetical protein